MTIQRKHPRPLWVFLGALAATIVAGCGGSANGGGNSNPAERLLMRTGAQQYVASTNPKVIAAHCGVVSVGNYSCQMDYNVTPPSGPRHELESTIPVSCSGLGCTADWNGATVGQSIGSRGAATNTSSTTTGPSAAKVQLLAHCVAADNQYLTLANDVQKMSANAPQSVFSQLVADADTYNTDLTELASSATPDQSAQLSQYKGVITQLETAARAASTGDLQAADAALVGIAPQIGKIPALVNQICGV